MSIHAAPEISCIMAVHRDDGYMTEAIQSVLAQTYPDFEFLIVANNCTDDLWTNLHCFQDPRLRLFRTSIGQLPYNLNYAVDHARAPYIARMDADDICAPHRFARQIKEFKDNPNLDILGSSYKRINSKGEVTGNFTPPLTNQDIRSAMLRENMIVHPSVMFKKATFLKHRGYAYGLFAEDYDLWLRMRRDANVTFGNLPDLLLSYRVHDLQMSSAAQAQKTFLEIFPLLLREFAVTKESGFLIGVLRRWFLSTTLWQSVSPAWHLIRKHT